MQNSTATALKKATAPTGKTLPLLAGLTPQPASPIEAAESPLTRFETKFERFAEQLGSPAEAAGRFLAALEQDRAQDTAAPSGDSPCPDGRAWCTGDADSHADPREHIHHGPAHAITDPAGQRVMEFSIAQWHDGRPELEFESGGQWDTFDLDQTDELIAATAAHLDKLRKARNQLAELLAAEARA